MEEGRVLWVAGLNQHCLSKQIEGTFSKYGRVANVSLMGKVAFINLVGDTDRAIAELDKKEVEFSSSNKLVIHVEYAKSVPGRRRAPPHPAPPPRPAPTHERSNTRAPSTSRSLVQPSRSVLRVENISPEVSRSSLKQNFEAFGPVISVDLDRTTAFVSFSNPAFAEDARVGMNGQTLAGRRVSVEFVSGSSSRKRGRSPSPIRRHRESHRTSPPSRYSPPRQRDPPIHRRSPERRPPVRHAPLLVRHVGVDPHARGGNRGGAASGQHNPTQEQRSVYQSDTLRRDKIGDDRDETMPPPVEEGEERLDEQSLNGEDELPDRENLRRDDSSRESGEDSDADQVRFRRGIREES